MKASRARELTDIANSVNSKILKGFLKEMKIAAKSGRDHIIIIDSKSTDILYEDEINTFKELGYTVEYIQDSKRPHYIVKW